MYSPLGKEITCLTSIRKAAYDGNMMDHLRKVICIILATLLPVLPVVGNDIASEKAETVRNALTIGSAVISLAIVAPNAYFLCPEGTPISNRLLVTIPVSGMAIAAGAFAGRWVADIALQLKTSPWFSPVVGAGLGFIGSALTGGISFALAFAIAMPVVEAPAGYWGDFTYLQAIGMAFVAGAFWGGVAGVPIGAITIPIVSVYMGF